MGMQKQRIEMSREKKDLDESKKTWIYSEQGTCVT